MTRRVQWSFLLAAVAFSTAQAQDTTKRIRVATFNINAASKGLDMVAKELGEINADVVGLQEVDVRTKRGNGRDQFLALGEAYPYKHFLRTSFYQGGEYGIAILSRYPLDNVRSLQLPGCRGCEPRGALFADVAVGGRNVRFVVTHLGLPSKFGMSTEEQGRQIEKILASAAEGERVVLVGDLNSQPSSSVIRKIKASQFRDACAATTRGSSDTHTKTILGLDVGVRIDYIFFRPGMDANDCNVRPRLASDHSAVVSTLELH